jgi:hypothetical protein
MVVEKAAMRGAAGVTLKTWTMNFLVTTQMM